MGQTNFKTHLKLKVLDVFEFLSHPSSFVIFCHALYGPKTFFSWRSRGDSLLTPSGQVAAEVLPERRQKGTQKGRPGRSSTEWVILYTVFFFHNCIVYIYIYIYIYIIIPYQIITHIFVWRSCFWFCIPPPPAASLVPPLVLTHLPPHNLSTQLVHTQLVLTPLVHTQLVLTQLAHTPLVLTHLVITHLVITKLALTQLVWAQFAHTQLAHTHLVLTNLCSHILSSHNLPSHNLHSPTCPHTTCSHTTYPHTICSLLTHNLSSHNLLTHNLSSHILSSHILSSHNLLTHILSSHNLLTHTLPTHNLSSHNLSTHTTCPHRHNFVWQAWHLVTWTFTLRGRRGTWRHVSSLCVAGGGTYGIGLAPVARLGRSGRFWRRGCWRRRRGTLRHPPSFHVADVALGDMDLHFAWQAWHLATCIFTLRGRRGTYGIGLTPVARLGRSGRLWRRGCWRGRRGRRGTLRHPPSFHVADVALGDMDLHFAWQARHLATCIFTLRGRRGTYGIGLAPVARLGRSGRFWRRGCWRRRRGTLRHPPSFHVADVALGDMDLHFAWQAWHLATCIFTLRGRRGTYGIGLAPVARLGRSGRFWRRGCWRGRRGTLRHPPSFHVADVVLGDIHLRFTWLPWHLVTSTATWCGRRGHVWHWAGSGGALGPEWPVLAPRLLALQAWHFETSTFVSRGRRGTWWHPPSFHVAGVALGDIDSHFVWQAWHVWHWAGSGGFLGWSGWCWCRGCWRGRRGTLRHPRFTWPAWHLVTSTATLCGRSGTYGIGARLWPSAGRLNRGFQWLQKATLGSSLALLPIALAGAFCSLRAPQRTTLAICRALEQRF